MLLGASASGQPLYHLHNIYTGGTYRRDALRIDPPDQAASFVSTVDLKGKSIGSYDIFDS
jgi:hypothetical protein